MKKIKIPANDQGMWSKFWRLVFHPTVVLAVVFGVGCSESSIPNKPSSENVNYGLYGARYHSPAVTVKDHKNSYWAQELVEDYKAPRFSNAPALFTPTQNNFLCELPRPSNQDHLVFVEIGSGSVELPLYFLEHSDVERARNPREFPLGIRYFVERSDVHQVNVYVTETDKPVYLMLASSSSTLWSLHLAAGVRLDGVAIIGNEAQALAHLLENIPVNFVVNDESQRECGTHVYRPVNETWTMLIKLDRKHGGEGFKHTLRETKDGHEHFHDWLYWHVGSPDVVISAETTSHVLVGPKPSVRIPYHSLKDTEVLYTPNVKPIWGDESDALRAFAELVSRTRLKE